MAIRIHLVAVAVLVTSCFGQEGVEPEEALANSVARLAQQMEAFKAQHQADLATLNDKIAQLQSQLEKARQHSAFMSQFSAPSKVRAPAAGPFHFDKVIFNDGSNYDGSQGVYTAPLSGVYVFSLKTFTGEHEAIRPAVDVVVNGVTLDRLAYDYTANQAGHGGDSHGMTTVVRLRAGDHVWVQSVGGFIAEDFYGGYHTTFSGALLRAD